MPHLHYSLDVASYDYHLFSNFQNYLVENIIEVFRRFWNRTEEIIFISVSEHLERWAGSLTDRQKNNVEHEGKHILHFKKRLKLILENKWSVRKQHYLWATPILAIVFKDYFQGYRVEHFSLHHIMWNKIASRYLAIQNFTCYCLNFLKSTSQLRFLNFFIILKVISIVETNNGKDDSDPSTELLFKLSTKKGWKARSTSVIWT